MEKRDIRSFDIEGNISKVGDLVIKELKKYGEFPREIKVLSRTILRGEYRDLKAIVVFEKIL